MMSRKMSLENASVRCTEDLVNRLRDLDSEKLITLCKMHMSFLFDLDSDKFVVLFGESKEPSKTGRGFPFRKRKNSRSDHLESGSISTDTISCVNRLIRYLHDKENICQEGLFRKSGNVSRQKELKEKLLLPGSVRAAAIDLASSNYTAHDCATVLKSVLGEMPEPLLTDRLYLAHCKVPELRTTEAQVKAVRLLFLMLPQENRQLLQQLLELLHEVAQTPSNRMTADSLGTVFAPHILCPHKITATELQSIAGSIQLAVSFMIQHADKLFTVPNELALDVRILLKEDGIRSPERAKFEQSSMGKSYSSFEGDDCEPISTVVAFNDRQISQVAESSMDTQVALAQLYAHVQSMPESAKKKKLMKQFNQANGYCAQGESKHCRSKSVAESVKKHFAKHKRQKSAHNSSLFAGVSDPSTGIELSSDPADEEIVGGSMSTSFSKQETMAAKVASMPLCSREAAFCFASTPYKREVLTTRTNQTIGSSTRSSSRQVMCVLNVSDTSIQL